MFKRIYPLIIFFNLITALAWAAPDGVKQNLSVNSTTELAELDTGGGTTWEELEDGDICWVISATGLSFRIYIYDSDSAQTEDGERYVTPDESSTGVPYSGDARWVCMSTAQAGSDGDYFLELGNNTAIDPDASKYQVYFDAGELKVNENGTEKYIANLTDAQTFAGALTLTGGIASIGAASNLSGSTVTLGTLAGTINLSSGTLGASGTGAITASDFALTADADAGDYDILSLDRLEGIDATEFIDLGADGYVVVDAGTAINLDSSVQAGDGTYSWDHTPAFGIEGILEVDGAAYLDGGLIVTGDLAVSGSVTEGAVASPNLIFKDSDNLGADKECARIEANATTTTDGAEDADLIFSVMQDGTVTPVLTFDESADGWNTAKDIEINSASMGLIIRDSEGQRYRITISTSGVLTATEL